MAKKTPKYHSTKLIVKQLNAAADRAETVAHDSIVADLIADSIEKLIDFDNSMWEQTKEMAEYLPV